ncbi:hypothetical protein [Brevibacterium pigmentatum]|uniref:hypothetical protein n=1 Tax=Brevibacterium pigmentatum TaxID=1496080 RepID=UPI00141E8537|nr:hypothetical protein [Brevibacterium pigmentatum]
MTAYRVTTITGQVLTIEADKVDFGPGHVVFSGVADSPFERNTIVRALRTPFVTEVTEGKEP